jgi:hypothetical protein
MRDWIPPENQTPVASFSGATNSAVSARAVEFFLHNIRTRMPFKYGIASLTQAPHMFTRVQLEIDGQVHTGLSADLLPPKWFTKNPETSYAADLRDMLQVTASACELAMEGIISKRADAPYRGARTKSWLKIKCTRRQEFVIVGWTASGASGRANSGSMLKKSRSSSAQDSYSTSATTYDDPADSKPDGAGDKGSLKPDGKGNVVVSVRVRPSSNTENGNPEGEWMVDGRRSLISYKGKEGGNHFYGKQWDS